MAAAKKSDPDAKTPPPDLAAILELLNEIKRELTSDPVVPPARPVPPLTAASQPNPEPRGPPLPPGGRTANRELLPDADDAMPPPVWLPRIGAPALLPESSPAPTPRESPPPPAAQPIRKTGPRIGIGVLLAFVYVAIFAAAALVISQRMHPADQQVAANAPAHPPPAATIPAPLPPPPEPVAAAAPPPPEPVAAAAPPPPESVAAAAPPPPAAVAATAPSPPAKPPETVHTEPAPLPAPAVVAAVPSPVIDIPAFTAPTSAPVETAPAVTQALTAPIPSAPRDRAAPAAPSTAEADSLRAQGDDSLRQGDVATARLFYRRAADAGDAQAALLLGHTYNPEFLERIGVRGLRGDLAQAMVWYRRARDLGDADADIVLRQMPQH